MLADQMTQAVNDALTNFRTMWRPETPPAPNANITPKQRAKARAKNKQARASRKANR